MNRTLVRGLAVLALVFGVPAVAFSGPNDVLLVFSANSEINRHLYSVVGGALESSGYRVTATLQPAAVGAGRYKAVVVFSTRVSAGIEPSLEAFLKAYPAPAELYLVSLLSRSPDLAVTKLSKGASPGGVDGVSAATAWSGASRSMHNQWIQILLSSLKAR